MEDLNKSKNDVKFVLNGLTECEKLSILFAASSDCLIEAGKENPKTVLQLIEIFAATLHLTASICAVELRKGK